MVGMPFDCSICGSRVLLTLTSSLSIKDVIVVFDKNRSAWDEAKQSTDNLKNLRELYVAVTRAKKRVVILTRESIETSFWRDCGVESGEAGVALLDFNKQTEAQDWFGEGKRYFNQHKYNVAEVG